jgi:hypothetical protein
VLPLQTARREWGFLALSGTIVPAETQFAESATDNLVMWATQLAAMLERRELGASLRQSYENERILASTVRELGAPIIPLLSGVLLIPLVGALDSTRAQQVRAMDCVGCGVSVWLLLPLPPFSVQIPRRIPSITPSVLYSRTFVQGHQREEHNE